MVIKKKDTKIEELDKKSSTEILVVEENEDDENIKTKQDKFMDSLNMIYKKAVDGIAGDGTPPAEKLARKYLEKNYGNKYKAAKHLVKIQQSKTFSTGFVSSFGGFALLPITIPADMTTSLFIELRMIAAIAALGGYDVHDPKVRTMSIVCLVGGNIKKILKNAGVKMSKEAMKKSFAKIPNKVFIDINKKVGAKLFAKAGGKGTAGLGRAIPVLGGFIGGGVNILFTGSVGKKAIDTFILEGMSKEEKEKYVGKKKKLIRIPKIFKKK